MSSTEGLQPKEELKETNPKLYNNLKKTSSERERKGPHNGGGKQEIFQREIVPYINWYCHNKDYVPPLSELKSELPFSKPMFIRKFDRTEDIYRQSNVKPPVDWVTDAIKDFVSTGKIYAKTKRLRKWMYPRGDMTHTGVNFQCDRTVNKNPGDKDATTPEDIMESWDYPRMSSPTVARVLKSLSNQEESKNGVSVNIWSESQNGHTYIFEVVEDE